MDKGLFLKYKNLIVIFLFSAIGFIYYRDVFNNWFIVDDPAAMLYSSKGLKEIFLSNSYSYAFYTPLVALSFMPDINLFGLNPVPYHIHNLVILIFISFMVYKILRLYVNPLESFVAGFFILLSTPSLMCQLWIILRQYLYPMLFSLISIYIFLRYEPDLKKNKPLVFLIVLLNELSFMGKEQFMTLPFVLFLIAKGTIKERFLKTYPYFLILIFHFSLRMYVLGGIGGYLGGEYLNYNFMDYIKILINSPLITSKILFGNYWFFFLFFIPFAIRPKRALLSILTWISALLISFLVMGSEPIADTYRYWFIPVVILSFLIAFSLKEIKKKYIKFALCSLVLIFFLINTYSENRDLKIQEKRKSDLSEIVSKALIDKKYKDSLILHPDEISLLTSSYIDNMKSLYSQIFKLNIFPSYIHTEILAFYPQIMNDYKKIYEIKDHSIAEVPGINEKIEKFKNNLSKNELTIDLKKEDKNKYVLYSKCTEGKAIVAFIISYNNPFNYSVAVGPYLEKIDLSPFFKEGKMALISKKEINYSNNQWFIGERFLVTGETIIMFSCYTKEQKLTELSEYSLLIKP